MIALTKIEEYLATYALVLPGDDDYYRLLDEKDWSAAQVILEKRITADPQFVPTRLCWILCQLELRTIPVTALSASLDELISAVQEDQKLHSLGLLSSSFLPDSTTDIIRTYSRHRQNILQQSARTVLKMQKYLRLMNLRLDVVVKDIVGETGTKIISAFIAGERSGKKLAENRHYNCRKSEEEIAKALQFNGRADYMFALKHEWETYLHLQQQLNEVDTQIKELLTNIIDKDDNKKQHVATQKTHKRKNKNTLRGTDMNQMAYQYFEGIDLMAIEGVNDATIMSIISEIGLEGIKKFETSKQFTAWLRLAPNNKISGGKVLNHHIPKGSSRLKIALRNAANAIGNLKEGHLSDFFKRICYKKGRTTAINATARKLAVIIWNMLVKEMPYESPTQYLFLDEKRKLGLVKRIKKQIAKFELQPEQLGFAIT